MNKSSDWAMVDREAGVVTWIGLAPDGIELPDGSTVTTPVDTPTDPKLLREAGYLPVYDAGPEDPPEGYEHHDFDYEVKETRVVRTKKFRPTPPDAMAELVQGINDLHERLAQDSADRQADRNAVSQALVDAQAILEQMEQAADQVSREMAERFHRETEDIVTRLASVEAKVAKMARGS